MTKMEAIAALWDIKRDCDNRANDIRISIKNKGVETHLGDYYHKELERYERFSRALEMAGKAMTK